MFSSLELNAAGTKPLEDPSKKMKAVWGSPFLFGFSFSFSFAME